MTYISVNSHIIRRNIKRGTDDPPIRIAYTKTDSEPIYAREVLIHGPSRLIYSPHEAILKCGARLALETRATVEVIR